LKTEYPPAPYRTSISSPLMPTTSTPSTHALLGAQAGTGPAP
jgi:hypothetical protein